MRGRLSIGFSFSHFLSFNPRPVRGRHPNFIRCFLLNKFQSTPRAGATTFFKGIPADNRVSIHAPVRGATVAVHPFPDAVLWFQSTPPCGGRRGPADDIIAVTVVSIHAPVRGATQCDYGLKEESVSNPRPRGGGDYCPDPGRESWRSFNHAPVRGRRRLWYRPVPFGRQCWPSRSFNPRPRAGGDGNA